MSFQHPTLYGPLARLGFSRHRRLRRSFRWLICQVYRRRIWNPLINSWMRYRGFDPRRHLWLLNVHAVQSAVLLLLVPCFLICALQIPQVQGFCYLLAADALVFDLLFNAPAIILCRYLYLLTLRKPQLTRADVTQA